MGRSTWTRHLATCAAALFVATGCSTAGGAGDDNEMPEWESTLELRVGSVDDPDYSLTWFRAMEVGPNGRMYTLHPQEQVVRVFTTDGTLDGVIGGRGGGPGEFGNAFGMGWVADTLWVLDANGYRFSQFSADGDFLRSFTVPFVMGDDPGAPQPARANGLLHDGTVHGSTPAFSNQIAEGTLTHHVPMLLTRDGVVTDTLPGIAFGNNQWTISDPDNSRRGGMYMRQPYADGPLWKYVPNERALIVVDRLAPTSAESAEFTVTKLGFAGDTVFSRSHAFDPLPTDLAEIDSILDDVGGMLAEREILGVSSVPMGREWAERGLYQPEFRPGVTDMVVARDGSIWLSGMETAPGQREWLAFDASGEPMGTTVLPSGVTVLAVDPPHVYGSETDELDVPYILRFRVER